MEWNLIPGNGLARCLEMNAWRDRFVVHRQNGLEHSRKSCRFQRMSNVGFDTSDGDRLIAQNGIEEVAERLNLGCITYLRASGMCLDLLDTTWIHLFRVRALNGLQLSFAPWGP